MLRSILGYPNFGKLPCIPIFPTNGPPARSFCDVDHAVKGGLPCPPPVEVLVLVEVVGPGLNFPRNHLGLFWVGVEKLS